MHGWLIMILPLLFSFFFSVAVVAILTPALRLILVDICGTDTRAKFWVTYSSVMLTLTPMLIVLVLGGNTSGVMSTEAFTPAMLRITLAGTIIGLITGLIIIGRQVSQSIASPKRYQEASPVSMLHSIARQNGQEVES